jgi:hypothetical protein
MNQRPPVQHAASTSDTASIPDVGAATRALPWTLIRRAWIRSGTLRSVNGLGTRRGGDTEAAVVDSERRAA